MSATGPERPTSRIAGLSLMHRMWRRSIFVVRTLWAWLKTLTSITVTVVWGGIALLISGAFVVVALRRASGPVGAFLARWWLVLAAVPLLVGGLVVAGLLAAGRHARRPARGPAVPPSKVPRIGLLVVHGIGSQKRGASASALVSGLKAVVPPGTGIDLTGPEPILTMGDRCVVVYDVHWADLLQGQAVAKTYDPGRMRALIWLPRRNLRAQTTSASRGRTLVWTWAAGMVDTLTWLAHLLMSKLLPKVCDEVLADVSNYVDSAAGVLPDDHPLHDVADRIHERLYEQLLRAVDAGCSEVHVVAHSLGTVIASRALFETPSREAQVALQRAVRRVTRLHTIGSPLDKFAFIWPGLFTARSGVLQLTDPQSFAWSNYYDRMDLVGGPVTQLPWGPVANRPTVFRGGLVKAHTSYQRDRGFVSVVAHDLFGRVDGRRVRWYGRMVDAGLGVLLALLPLAVLFTFLVIGVLVETLVMLVLMVVATVLTAMNSYRESGTAFSGGQFIVAYVVFAVLGLAGLIGYPLYATYRTPAVGQAAPVKPSVTGVPD